MMRWGEMKMVVTELLPFVAGGQLQKVRQPDAETLVLFIRRPGRTTKLVLSCLPRVARIAATEESPTTRQDPTALGAWVRSAGGGRAIRALELSASDRIVTLGLADGALVAELTGPRANLLGIAADGRLVTAARPIHGSRGLVIGQPYTPPEQGLSSVDEASRFQDALAVEAAAQERCLHDRLDAARARRRQLLKRAQRKLARLEAHVERDERHAERAGDLQRAGELLKGQLHRARPGADHVHVQDWYSEGMPTIRIPLDPKLDGSANLAKIFRQYRRARDSAAHVAQRRAHVDALRERLHALMTLETPLDQLENELTVVGLLKTNAVMGVAASQHVRLPYRAFTSARGEMIRVGKGGKDNHETTFRHARGNDFWLHVRDAPGAHVIVPCPARDKAPHEETLRDAAALAVHYSKLRGEALVDVSLTQRKNVRPIKGAAPGRVSVASSRSICVSDGATRIERLFRQVPV
ncbi:MAG: NFACT RNA binding domain-containing protein [Myxococcota bacterium]|nr:NFACT RNA binding domain-containing protein [Myxococcota bacterium]